jgi:hypothetical protein
MQKRAHNTW